MTPGSPFLPPAPPAVSLSLALEREVDDHLAPGPSGEVPAPPTPGCAGTASRWQLCCQRSRAAHEGGAWAGGGRGLA